MDIDLEIFTNGINENAGFQKHTFFDITEAISHIEFLKLSYNYFENNRNLIVRINSNANMHYINVDSITQLLELKSELELFYKINSNDYEFKITTKEQEENLNSNFIFPETETTQYATTAGGKKLPFKLYRPNGVDLGSNLLRQNENNGSSTNFALIERQFIESKIIDFVGPAKIESADDVAWLFKSLEDETVEHAFLVYHFKEDYFVQHISSGTFNSTIVDNKLLIGNILEANPDSITLVHNHPSGQLKASKADQQCIKNLTNALLYSEIEVNPGVIINLRSGKYVTFDDLSFEGINSYSFSSNDLIPVQTYAFQKHILIENYQPFVINSTEDVAKFLTTQKFGVSDKTEMLVLNNTMNIVGKFILPQYKEVDFIIKTISKFGGANCILYGNNVTPELINFYNERLTYSRMSIVDGIQFKSENGIKMYKSFMADDLLNKKIIEQDINSDLREPNFKTNYNSMNDSLTWIDKNITPKTKDYISFIEKNKNVSLEAFSKNDNNQFTSKENKFIDVYLALKSNERIGNPIILSTLSKDDTLITTDQFTNPVDIFKKLKSLDFSNGVVYTLNDNLNKMKFILDNDLQVSNAIKILSNNLEYKFFLHQNIVNEPIKINYMNLSDLYNEMRNNNYDKSSFVNFSTELNNELQQKGINFLEETKGLDLLKQVIDIQRIVPTELKQAVYGYLIPRSAPQYDTYSEEEQSNGRYLGDLEDYTEMFGQYMTIYETTLSKYDFDISKYIKAFIGKEHHATLLYAEVENIMGRLENNISENFTLSNLNITSEQRRTYSHTQEYGYSDTSWDDDSELSNKQLLNIPDYVDGHNLTIGEKSLLATGVLEFPNSGETYSIKDGKIKKTTLDETLEESSRYLKNDEIKYYNQTPNKMENKPNNKEELTIGRLASVQFHDGIFKGTIESLNENKVSLKALNGNVFDTERQHVYQFFPGQKYAIQEIADLFLNKPAGLEFKDIPKDDLTRLLRGEMTNNTFSGVSTKPETLGKEYDLKVRPEYNSEHKRLELKPYFKNSNELDLQTTKVFGKELEPSQIDILNSGKQATIDRTNQNGKEYTAKVHLDTDLNQIIFDSFVNKKDLKSELNQESDTSVTNNLKEPKIPFRETFQDQSSYEEFLMNEVNIFPNATKVNAVQLDKMLLVLDQSELDEFLTDFSIESSQINELMDCANLVKSDDRIDNIKSSILAEINSSAEKVDLFKQQFKPADQSNTLKR